jgi:protoporphyrinogen/coproporphyrinogen III oxidase
VAPHGSGEEGRHDVVVVGGGIAGLAAAWNLRDADVVLLETGERVGGRILSYPRGDAWMNLGAHVFGGAETAAGRLIDETGVEAASVPGRLAAVSLRGRLVATGPVETYPFRLPLSPRSRVALARAGLKLRLAVRRYARIARPRPGEDAAERQQRMLDFLDDRSFAEFIGPLPEDVDALLRCTLTRSSGEPEELAAGYGVGYFHLVWNRDEGLSRNIVGGSARLTDALAAGLGDRIRRDARVTLVEQTDDGVRVLYGRAGREHELRAQSAIVATPAYETRRIVAGLPAETASALDQVRYGPYAVAAFLTNRRAGVPWEEVYALATPHRSFSMLFNTANVLPPGEGDGSLMAYAAAELGRTMLELSDGQIADRFRSELEAVFPGSGALVREIVVQRWERGLPFPHPGRASLQRPLTRPLGRIHLAGDYLGTWYTETAAQTATAAAASARATIVPT